MTEQEVNQIIAQDYQKLHDTLFPDELPPWLLDNFANVLLEMPQNHYNYFARTAKSILGKGNNTDKLTVYETGFVCHLWCTLPPKFFLLPIDDFLDKKEKIEPIARGYKVMMDREENKLQAKKESFMKNIRRTKLITV